MTKEAIKEILFRAIEKATSRLDLTVADLAVEGAHQRGVNFDQNERDEFTRRINFKANKIALDRQREDDLVGGVTP